MGFFLVGKEMDYWRDRERKDLEDFEVGIMEIKNSQQNNCNLMIWVIPRIKEYKLLRFPHHYLLRKFSFVRERTDKMISRGNKLIPSVFFDWLR